MKLLLINPGYYKLLQLPLSLASIAAFVREKGNHEVKVVDENVGQKLSNFKDFKPDLVGITSATPLFVDALRCANESKKLFPNALTIIGGIHVTSLPEHTMQNYSEFDFGVVGEGEQTVLELCNHFQEKGKLSKEELTGINGLVFKKEGKIIRTPKRELIQNLDDIPIPARDLFEMKEFYTQPRAVIRGIMKRTIQIMSSRGCPYDCAFCASARMWERKFRFHSPERVIKEIEHLIETYNISALFFVDDTFIANKDRVKRICDLMIERGINKRIVWSCQLRANLVDKEIVDKIKSAGCVQAEFGLESGNERVLSMIKGNSVTIKQNTEAIRICKEAGLRVLANFVVGNPSETREEIIDTLNFIKNNPLNFVHPHIATPFPGSRYWEIAKQQGKINENNVDWTRFQMSQVQNNVVVADKITEKELYDLYSEISAFTAKINKNSFVVGDVKEFLNLKTVKRVLRTPKHIVKFGPKIIKQVITKK
ncbi:MAG: radical SAM protein [archaeon]